MGTINRVWVVGANGQLGNEISRLLDLREIEILNTDVEEVDITKNEQVIAFGDRNRPDVIINCAGMTDIVACENNREQAFKVNALGAKNLSISARKIGAKMIHLSTDDVFDGKSSNPYSEFDTPNPISVFGKTKLAGEMFVREFAPKHMIIRSSWIYGEGDNFVTTLLNKARNNQSIEVPENQYGSPTSAGELAKLIVYLMQTSEYGLYHGTCKGICSRYEFAKEICRLANLNVTIIPTKVENDTLSIARPNYAVLDNFMLRLIDGYQMCSWKDALAEYFRRA